MTPEQKAFRRWWAERAGKWGRTRSPWRHLDSRNSWHAAIEWERERVARILDEIEDRTISVEAERAATKREGYDEILAASMASLEKMRACETLDGSAFDPDGTRAVGPADAPRHHHAPFRGARQFLGALWWAISHAGEAELEQHLKKSRAAGDVPTVDTGPR